MGKKRILRVMLLLNNRNKKNLGIEKICRVCPGDPAIQPNIIPRLYVKIDQKKFDYEKVGMRYKELKKIPIFEGQPQGLL